MYIKNIFCDKMYLRFFYFHVAKCGVLSGSYIPFFELNMDIHSVFRRIHDNLDLKELHIRYLLINILFKKRFDDPEAKILTFF